MIPTWQNNFVVIDWRSTSLGSLGELAAIQVNSEFKPVHGVRPFHAFIIPVSCHTQTLRELALKGLCHDDVVLLWKNWRPDNVIPVCIDWAGLSQELYDFGPFVTPARDLQQYVAYMHDRHWWHNYNPGFSTFGRQKLFEICSVPCEDTKNPLICCNAIRQCFHNLFTHPLP